MPAAACAPCPSDFRYFEAVERPAIRRLRSAARVALRFDPLPTDEQVRMLIADMYDSDPVAEAFVDDVFFGEIGARRGRAMLDQALEGGIESVPEAPDAMRALFDEFETVPDWVRPELVEEGARIWRRWGKDLFAVAGAETLEMYTESAVAVPLSLTGGYAGDKALRRFLETVRFWIDVSEPGTLLRIGSEGRATAMRVRVMHVAVRRRVAEHEEWSHEKWGYPISQAWQSLTLMGGSITPALLLMPHGYLTTPKDIRALLHYQRFLGHLLGVRPRWYPKNVRESLRLTAAIAAARSYTAGDHGAELIESFPRAFEPRTRQGLRKLRDRYDHQLMVGFTAACMSPSTRRKYDMPAPVVGLALLAMRMPFRLIGELAGRVSPQVGNVLERRSVRQREAWYQAQMDGRTAKFEAESNLRR